jgi:hypothetical protein
MRKADWRIYFARKRNFDREVPAEASSVIATESFAYLPGGFADFS